MTAETALRVDFRVTEEDVFRYRMTYGQFYWRLPAVFAFMLAALYRPIIGVITNRASASDRSFLERVLPALLLMGVLGFCLAWLYYRWDTRRACRNVPGATQRETLEISPEGLCWLSELGESRLKWSWYTRVCGSRDFICFYVGPRVGAIVPRRAFALPEQAEAFLQAAKGWHAAATGRPAR